MSLPSWACGFERARAVRSLVCMPCFVLERGVRIPALMSWVSVSCQGSDTRAPCSVLLCECAVSSSLGRALFCPLVLCFVVLHAVHVMSCAVWHADCVFHWLHAFMLSCFVWTRGLWVFSLAAWVFMSCFAHVWWFVLFWLCACVFVLCEHMAFVLVFCVPCALMPIVLTPPILLPDYWFIFRNCCPSLPSSFALFIISLCLKSCLQSCSSSYLPQLYPVPALPFRALPFPACQTVSPLRVVLFVCLFCFIFD